IWRVAGRGTGYRSAVRNRRPEMGRRRIAGRNVAHPYVITDVGRCRQLIHGHQRVIAIRADVSVEQIVGNRGSGVAGGTINPGASRCRETGACGGIDVPEEEGIGGALAGGLPRTRLVRIIDAGVVVNCPSLSVAETDGAASAVGSRGVGSQVVAEQYPGARSGYIGIPVVVDAKTVQLSANVLELIVGDRDIVGNRLRVRAVCRPGLCAALKDAG